MMKEYIASGKAVLGIELGSTRIKAVLIDENHAPIASGSHEWENQFVNGVWTYSMDAVWSGLQACYADLRRDVQEKYGVGLKKIAAIGISAMMHGYLAFDAQGKLLAPFRTWRNTITGPAAAELTEVFGFNIPQRWSIAHLHQALLNGEAHVSEIDFITTLAGYVHWQLTGRKVLGVGDASGMFPIDSDVRNYDAKMIAQYDAHIEKYAMPWKISGILPQVLCAGDDAGVLTAEGAKLLDVSGELEGGIVMCPPEGDAGTGMTATNSVGVRTGNVSAGTSIFAMIVLEKALSQVYTEIDMVTTPSGEAVAMVHCNNCTTDLNDWVGLFGEFAKAVGLKISTNDLYGTLFRKALEGAADCGGIVSYNYHAGEPITGLEEGRPLMMRLPDADFSLANFMRTNLYGTVATLKIGMEILTKENVAIDRIFGHGGLFKTKGVGQRVLAAAIEAPVSVMETAGEGGAWGIALLADYAIRRAEGQTLEAYLNDVVFAGMAGDTLQPDEADVKGFNDFMVRYNAGLAAQRAAVEYFK